MKLLNFLIKEKTCRSMAEAKRLVLQGSISINNVLINNQDINLNNNDKIKVGKNKNFIYKD